MRGSIIALFLFLSSCAYGQCTFSPSGGTYPTAQTVTISCSAGLTPFYTIDGSTPSIAGYQYTTPLTVGATQTVKVIAAQVGVLVRNAGLTSSGWKCNTYAGGTNNGITCNAVGGSGGIGTINPSNWSWTYGSPMTESMSTTSATGTTQMLFIHTASTTACTTCNEIVEDKIVQPSKGTTFNLNHEMDANNNNLTTYNQFHTASLQCNQQSGNPAGNGFPGGMQWQYDNQQGPWQNTGITFGCPLSTTQQTEIRYGIHWTNGDTSCSGFSCDSYDFLTVCVGGTLGTGGTCQTFSLGHTLPGYEESGFTQSAALQDQHDMTNTTTCGTSPCTSNRQVWNDNMTLAHYGTEVTSSATYVITGGLSSSMKMLGHMNKVGTMKVR